MSIIQKERIENTIYENTKKININELNVIDKINNYENESYTEDIKEYLLNNIIYIAKNNKVPLLKENTLEFNKKLMLIKKDLEKYLK